VHSRYRCDKQSTLVWLRGKIVGKDASPLACRTCPNARQSFFITGISFALL
jgi:hypothetical protein